MLMSIGASPKTILIVEDDALSMRLFRDVQRVHGYRVLQSSRGIEALRLARQHRPDIILMDIQLPDVSGLEVVRWIKEDERLSAIPIVAVTASAMKEDKARMLGGGCDAYLAKPVPLRQLVATVERHLHSAGSV
jgi:two-component system, cell cycle response regulator DivK